MEGFEELGRVEFNQHSLHFIIFIGKFLMQKIWTHPAQLRILEFCKENKIRRHILSAIWESNNWVRELEITVKERSLRVWGWRSGVYICCKQGGVLCHTVLVKVLGKLEEIPQGGFKVGHPQCADNVTCDELFHPSLNKWGCWYSDSRDSLI